MQAKVGQSHITTCAVSENDKTPEEQERQCGGLVQRTDMELACLGLNLVFTSGQPWTGHLASLCLCVLKLGLITVPISQDCCEDEELTFVRHLEPCLAHNRPLIQVC